MYLAGKVYQFLLWKQWEEMGKEEEEFDDNESIWVLSEEGVFDFFRFFLTLNLNFKRSLNQLDFQLF